MGWVAKKKMKIQRGSSLVTVLAGDPVPEAEHWKTRKALERQNFIEWIDEKAPVEEVNEAPIEMDAPSLTFPKQVPLKTEKPSKKKKAKKRKSKKLTAKKKEK